MIRRSGRALGLATLLALATGCGEGDEGGGLSQDEVATDSEASEGPGFQAGTLLFGDGENALAVGGVRSVGDQLWEPIDTVYWFDAEGRIVERASLPLPEHTFADTVSIAHVGDQTFMAGIACHAPRGKAEMVGCASDVSPFLYRFTDGRVEDIDVSTVVPEVTKEAAGLPLLVAVGVIDDSVVLAAPTSRELGGLTVTESLELVRYDTSTGEFEEIPTPKRLLNSWSICAQHDRLFSLGVERNDNGEVASYHVSSWSEGHGWTDWASAGAPTPAVAVDVRLLCSDDSVVIATSENAAPVVAIAVATDSPAEQGAATDLQGIINSSQLTAEGDLVVSTSTQTSAHVWTLRDGEWRLEHSEELTEPRYPPIGLSLDGTLVDAGEARRYTADNDTVPVTSIE